MPKTLYCTYAVLFFFQSSLFLSYDLLYSVQLQRDEDSDTLVHAGLFWCFHNPLKFNMDYRIFNVRMSSFLHAYAHRGLRFIVSPEGLL